MPVSSVLALVGFVGLCLLVGLVDGSMMAHAMPHWYRLLHQPAGVPPAWLFGPVWVTVYAGTGVAGWLAWKQVGAAAPLRLWGWQLAANALWAPAFFGLHSPLLAFSVAVVLLVLVALTGRCFRRISAPAALLLLPYLAWCLYTAYLNMGFVLLNRF